jgi:hypothetical protein
MYLLYWRLGSMAMVLKIRITFYSILFYGGQCGLARGLESAELADLTGGADVIWIPVNT